jgi:FkbM family methyltransferase
VSAIEASSRAIRIIKRLRFRAIKALRAETSVVAHVCGLKVRIETASSIAEEVYANAFERHERGVIARLVAADDIIIDVGANVGVYTCLLASLVGSGGRVVAFEPTPAMADLLEENVRENDLARRVTVRREALSDDVGRMTLHCFPPGFEVYNSLGARQTIGKVNAPLCEIEVNVVRLGDVVDSLSADGKLGQLFVKVDVEGFEQRVLLGAVDALTKKRDVALMVELYEPASRQCGYSTLDSVATLERCGFSVFVVRAGHLEKLDKDARQDLLEGRLRVPNVFFLKGSALLRAERNGLFARR